MVDTVVPSKAMAEALIFRLDKALLLPKARETTTRPAYPLAFKARERAAPAALSTLPAVVMTALVPLAVIWVLAPKPKVPV